MKGINQKTFVKPRFFTIPSKIDTGHPMRVPVCFLRTPDARCPGRTGLIHDREMIIINP